MKLERRNKIQVFLVLGHVVDGNEVADQLARQDSSHPFTGPEPTLGMSAKVAGGVVGLNEQETRVLAVHLWTEAV
jgi:hypothetical protein